MPSSIWTRCAGDTRVGPLRLEPWRVVESQHQVSTRRLVDSDAEHRVLEALIDASKPPEPTAGRLHYLLFTPFRYPPLRRGSRFGRRTERGIWYGSETVRTALAETAYYRLVFLEGTAADLGTVATQLTAFRVEARTERGVDLTAPPFAAHHDAIVSPVRYEATQALGAAMRGARVEMARYPSARDVAGGINVAVLAPSAFGSRRPRSFQSWHCVARRDGVEFASRSWFDRVAHTFPRRDFLIGDHLPAPAL